MQEDIFKGATRPPMLWGVPMMPMVALSLLTILLVIWGGFFLGAMAVGGTLLAAVPIFVWMRMVSKRDDHRLNQMFIRAKLLILQKNRALWKCRSYSPVQFKGSESKYFR